MRARVAALLGFAVGCGSNVSIEDDVSSGNASGGAGPSSTATNAASSSATGAGGAVPCVPGSVESCYEGPPGTLGVGLCASGTHVCESEGSFGPCLDQVLPSLEDCGTTEDESCDGNGACTGDALWTFGSKEFVIAQAYSVAVDPANDVVVAGTYWSGDLVFGGTTLMYTGVSDAFVAKFGASGSPLWAKSFGDIWQDSGLEVATDAQANVVVAGILGGPVSSEPGVDLFLEKLDASGNSVWGKLLPCFGVSLRALAVDGEGAIYLGGVFADVVLDSMTLDAVLLKLDAAGNLAWWRQFNDTFVEAIAVDALDNVILIGMGSGEAIDFGGGPVPAPPDQSDLWMVKLDSTGAYSWSRRFGTNYLYNMDVAVDASGDIVVAGQFELAIDFGAGPLAGDVFVARFDSDGDHLWSKGFGQQQHQGARSVDFDSQGNVVITGHFSNTIDFGGGSLTAPPPTGSHQRIFLAKLDALGDHLWSKAYGDGINGIDGGNEGLDLACDSAGNTLLTGSFTGTVDFGNGPLAAQSYSHMFLAKMGP